MSKQQEAMRLALEALEAVNNESLWWGKKDAAITALRAALAEPEQKPVTWKLVPVEPTHEMLKAMDECSTEGYDERLLAGQAASVYMAAVDVAPLYTAPPQRNPLTDEEIGQLLGAIADTPRAQWLRQAAIEVVRKTEAAHGIKEQEHD